MLYGTDAYAPYDGALRVGRHDVGEDVTVTSERSHARLRHWFARRRRRTVVVPRSAAMVDRSVALFAHYRCNSAATGPGLVA